MEQTKPLTEQIRDWYEHSPTPQRAYARVRADVDAAVEQVKPKVQELWAQVGPLIDPPAKTGTEEKGDAESTTGARDT